MSGKTDGLSTTQPAPVGTGILDLLNLSAVCLLTGCMPCSLWSSGFLHSCGRPLTPEPRLRGDSTRGSDGTSQGFSDAATTRLSLERLLGTGASFSALRDLDWHDFARGQIVIALVAQVQKSNEVLCSTLLSSVRLLCGRPTESHRPLVEFQLLRFLHCGFCSLWVFKANK